MNHPRSTHNPQIVSIEWGNLEGQRPRKAGCNARLAVHGLRVQVPLARITTDDGASGFGACRLDEGQGSTILGRHLNDLFSSEQGVAGAWLPFEYPIWDLVGHCQNQPVYRLTAMITGKAVAEPFTVPCYDTSLYIDDLHLETDEEAAKLLAEEARQGYQRGHRAFKIKVGRGARHMPLAEGTARDIAVIQAIRGEVGPEATLMIDANNGYNLNIAKRVLAETADCNLFWLEEAFHEDPVLYADLRDWIAAQGLSVLIADGEGLAAPRLMDWAQEGLVQVVQYDIFSHGLTRWLSISRQLDAWQVRTAPHHYGRHIGNYVTGHLASAVEHFGFVEWDEATTPGLEAPGYNVNEGRVSVPNTPGFGLALDEDQFQRAVSTNGFKLSL